MLVIGIWAVLTKPVESKFSTGYFIAYVLELDGESPLFGLTADSINHQPGAWTFHSEAKPELCKAILMLIFYVRINLCISTTRRSSMQKDVFNIDAYFKRIDYSGKKDVSYETLHGLHTAHTLNIPFENLDVYFRKPIPLDQDSLYEKIVKNKRGGYCFEMNGLFSIVLKQLGFKVTDLLARVSRDGVVFNAKTHQVLMVEIGNDRYLADVGFGNNGLAAPILLSENIDQPQFMHTYRLVNDQEHGYVLQRKADGSYHNMYAFTLEECISMDYEVANFYCYANPNSVFRAMKFITRPTMQGRLTLTDRHLKILDNGMLTEKILSSDEEYKMYLLEHFGLDWELMQKEGAVSV